MGKRPCGIKGNPIKPPHGPPQQPPALHPTARSGLQDSPGIRDGWGMCGVAGAHSLPCSQLAGEKQISPLVLGVGLFGLPGDTGWLCSTPGHQPSSLT